MVRLVPSEALGRHTTWHYFATLVQWMPTLTRGKSRAQAEAYYATVCVSPRLDFQHWVMFGVKAKYILEILDGSVLCLCLCTPKHTLQFTHFPSLPKVPRISPAKSGLADDVCSRSERNAIKRRKASGSTTTVKFTAKLTCIRGNGQIVRLRPRNSVQSNLMNLLFAFEYAFLCLWGCISLRYFRQKFWR